MNNIEKIIKGIKTCGDDKSSCKDCPYYELKSPMCLDTLHKEATGLIRRQQAEINHFVEANKMVVEPKTVKNDDDEILRLLVNQSVKFIPRNDDIKAIQRDAVVNFAERLKEQAFECDISFGLGSQRVKKAVAVDDIDKALNEMFGNSEQVKGEADEI